MVTRSEREFQTQGAGRASPITHPDRGSALSAATLPDISYTRRLNLLDVSPSMTRPKTALIIEGGEMRGAWAAGALAALRQFQHDPFDLVVAVSSGACSAAYFVADVFERGLSIWTKWVCGGRVLRVSNWLHFRPLVDLSYLVDYCFRKFVPLPVEVFDRSPTRFEIVLTDCRTGRPVYFQPDSGSVLPALKATASLPFATRGYSLVNEIPYADGGLADPIPIRRAIELGATDITVVLTHNANHRVSPIPRWLCRLAYPSFPETAAAWQASHLALNRALDLIAGPPAGIRLRVVCPRRPLAVRMFSETTAVICAAVGHGYKDAMSQLQSPPAALAG